MILYKEYAANQNIIFSSETWILPFIALFAMMAYAMFAIVFFTNAG